MFDLIFLFIIGFAVSAFGTLVGFGGGVFMVPILTLVFHIPIQLAIGSVILALFPAALLSTFFNWRLGTVDFVVGTFLEIPTVLGTLLGAWLTSYLPTWQLQILFSVMVIWVGAGMLSPKSKTASARPSMLKKLNNIPPRLVRDTANGCYEMGGVAAGLFGTLSGVVAGLFGIGGGFIKGPLMVLGFGMPARVAAPTALFMIVITSVVGSASHYLLGHVQWKISLLLVAAFTAGAFFGNKRAVRISEQRLIKFIGLGLVAAGLTMSTFTLFQLLGIRA